MTFLLVVSGIRITFSERTELEPMECRGKLPSINYILKNELSEFPKSPYIDSEVKRFLRRWELKGMSMSIVKNSKLVFSKGYGWANLEKAELMTPAHIMRVASVSKLITAIGVMKLVEDSLLTLDDKVFGEEGIINDTIYGKIRDRRLKRVTVRNLLNHSAGWSQRYGDPAFHPARVARRVNEHVPVTLDTYLKYIMKQRLHFSPGTRSVYSNMGFMVLERVIEKVSGQSYEDYILYHILYPAGIYDMHIGLSRYADARINECRYYEQRGERQVMSVVGDGIVVNKSDGGNDIQLLGAAGGWICSSAELAKLITLIDGDPTIPDILSPHSIKEMTMTKNGMSPLGWRSTLRNGTWWRTGSFAGTSAMLKRLPDGTVWVVLINSSSWKGSKFPPKIDYLMRKINRHINEWPENNLFEYLHAQEYLAVN